MKNITLTKSVHCTHLTVLGFHFVWGWCGNCLRPCLNINAKQKLAHLYLGFANTIDLYWNGSLRWNWNVIARKFGTASEHEFGTVYIYKGILGYHTDL